MTSLRRAPLDSSETLLVCLLVALFATTDAAAQTKTEGRATWTAPDTVTITAVVQAPDNCYSAGSTAPGWPDGTPKVERALPVTFSLARFGEGCAQVIKPVTFSMTSTVPANTQAIVIYLVNPHTKQTTLHAVALPPKPGSESSGSTVSPPSLRRAPLRHDGERAGAQRGAIDNDVDRMPAALRHARRVHRKGE